MCCVLDASKILTSITFGQGTKVLLTCRLTRNGNLSRQPLLARAVLKLQGKAAPPQGPQTTRADEAIPAAWRYSPRSFAPHLSCAAWRPISAPAHSRNKRRQAVGRCGRERLGCYLSLDVWPARQARNAAAACSRSSALLTLRRGCFAGWTATGVAPLISSTPCRRIQLRCFIRDQFVRPVMTPIDRRPPQDTPKPRG
jgi:hypothetical protein